MTPPRYDFGFSQEDERTERAALHLRPGDRALCISSGGEVPLGLLAAGAASVVSVDINPAQNRLARLKLASALTLPRPDAAGFIGYTERTAAARRQDWLRVREALSAEDAAFWEAAPQVLGTGPIWDGRFERYVRLLQCGMRPLLGRALRGLFDQPDLTAQATPLLRGVLRLAFSPRVYAGRGVDPRSLAHRSGEGSLGERYFQQLRDVCTRTPARDNPLLQLLLLGYTLSADAVPDWLSASGLAALRPRADRITWVDGDLVPWLEATPASSVDAVHLSNLPDWLDEAGWERLLTALIRVAAPGARVVWRYMHVDRRVPPALADKVRVDRELGARLRQTDRFPFYTIVPAAFP